MPFTEEGMKQLRIQRNIFLALNTAAAIAMAVLVGLVIHTNHKVNGQTAEIQRQRAENIMRDCVDQNNRHDKTVRTLDELLKKSGVSPARRAASRQTTVLLINALAPKQDCDKLVAKSVGDTD